MGSMEKTWVGLGSRNKMQKKRKNVLVFYN